MKRTKILISQADIARIAEIKDFIQTNLGEDLRIEILASRFNMAKSTLQRHFFSIYHQSIHAYIIDCRMNRAVSLLQNGTAANTVHLLVGYLDRTSFIREFKKKFDRSPSLLSSHFNASNEMELKGNKTDTKGNTGNPGR